jgi:MFS family permease
MIFITLTGATQTMFFSLSNAVLLHTAPAEMRGRVISLLSLDRAMMSLGGMGAGFLAELQGVQFAQIVFGSVCVIGGLAILVLFKELRHIRMEPGSIPVGRGHHIPPATPTEPAVEPAPTR